MDVTTSEAVFLAVFLTSLPFLGIFFQWWRWAYHGPGKDLVDAKIGCIVQEADCRRLVWVKTVRCRLRDVEDWGDLILDTFVFSQPPGRRPRIIQGVRDISRVKI